MPLQKYNNVAWQFNMHVCTVQSSHKCENRLNKCPSQLVGIRHSYTLKRNYQVCEQIWKMFLIDHLCIIYTVHWTLHQFPKHTFPPQTNIFYEFLSLQNQLDHFVKSLITREWFKNKIVDCKRINEIPNRNSDEDNNTQNQYLFRT